MATKVAVNTSLQDRKEKKRITSSRVSSGTTRPVTARTSSANAKAAASRLKKTKDEDEAEKKKCPEDKKSETLVEKKVGEERFKAVDEKKKQETSKKAVAKDKASPVTSSRAMSKPGTRASATAATKPRDATDSPKVLSSSRLTSGSTTAASKRTIPSVSSTHKATISNGTAGRASKTTKPPTSKTAPSSSLSSKTAPSGSLSSKSASAVSKATSKSTPTSRSASTRPQSARTAASTTTPISGTATTKTSAPSTADSKTTLTKQARPLSTRAGATTSGSARLAASKPKVVADSASKGAKTTRPSLKPVSSRTSTVPKTVPSSSTSRAQSALKAGTASKSGIAVGTKKPLSALKSSAQTPKPSGAAATTGRKPLASCVKVASKTPTKPSPTKPIKPSTSPAKKAVKKPLVKKQESGKKVDIPTPKAEEPSAQVIIDVSEPVQHPAASLDEVPEKTEVEVTISVVKDVSPPRLGLESSLSAEQPAVLPPDTAQRVGLIISSQTSLSKELQSKLPRVGEVLDGEKEEPNELPQPDDKSDEADQVVPAGEEVQAKIETELAEDLSAEFGVKTKQQEEDDVQRQQEEEREERRKRVDEIMERTRPKEVEADLQEGEVEKVREKVEQVEEEVEQVQEEKKVKEVEQVKERVEQVQEEIEGKEVEQAQEEVEQAQEEMEGKEVEQIQEEVEQAQEEVEQVEERVEQVQEEMEVKEVEQVQEEMEVKEVEQVQEEMEVKEVEQVQEEVEVKEVEQVQEEVEVKEVEQVQEEMEVKEVEQVQEEMEVKEVEQVQEEMEVKEVEQIQEEVEQVQEEVDQVEQSSVQLPSDSLVVSDISDPSGVLDESTNLSTTEEFSFNRGTISAQDSFEFKLAYEPQELQAAAMVVVVEEGYGNEREKEEVLPTEGDLVQFAVGEAELEASQDTLVEGDHRSDYINTFEGTQIEVTRKDEEGEEEQKVESEVEPLEGASMSEMSDLTVPVEDNIIQTQETEEDGSGIENEAVDDGMVAVEPMKEVQLDREEGVEDKETAVDEDADIQEEGGGAVPQVEDASGEEPEAVNLEKSEELEEELIDMAELEEAPATTSPLLGEVEDMPEGVVKEAEVAITPSTEGEEVMREDYANLDGDEGVVMEEEKDTSTDEEDVDIPEEREEAVPQVEVATERAVLEESMEAEEELLDMAEPDEAPSATTAVFGEVEDVNEAEIDTSPEAIDAQVEETSRVPEPLEASVDYYEHVQDDMVSEDMVEDASKDLGLDVDDSQLTAEDLTSETTAEGDQGSAIEDLLQMEEIPADQDPLGEEAKVGMYLPPLVPELVGTEEDLTVGDGLDSRSSGRSESGSGIELADTPVLPALGGSASSSPIGGQQEEDTQVGGDGLLHEEAPNSQKNVLVDLEDSSSPDVAEVPLGTAELDEAPEMGHGEQLIEVPAFPEEDLTVGDNIKVDEGALETGAPSETPELVAFESPSGAESSSEPLLPGLTDSNELMSTSAGIVDMTSAPQDHLTNPFSTSDPFGFKLEEESGTYPQSTSEVPSDPFFNLEESAASKSSPDPLPVSATLATDESTGGNLLTFEGDSSI